MRWVSGHEVVTEWERRQTEEWTPARDSLRDLMEDVPESAGGITGLSKREYADDCGCIYGVDYHGVRRGLVLSGRKVKELMSR